jgi:hypothetical protein
VVEIVAIRHEARAFDEREVSLPPGTPLQRGEAAKDMSVLARS